MKKLIGEWLEEVVDMWTDGVSYLFGDAVISFYTFFTLIFAECAYLWTFQEKSLAIPFSVILLGYVLNVCVWALFKGWHEGERKELVFTIIYVADFVVLFAIGCFINFWLSVILTIIPFAITALWIAIREFQICIFVGPHPKIVMLISKLFMNKIFHLVSQLIVVGVPFVVFVVFLAQIPTLHTALKIIISVLYFICIPLIAYYEDDTAALNIYELAYEVTWSRHYEEYVRKPIQKMKDEDK